MSTFHIYSLVTGRHEATCTFDDPRDAALYRQRLERQLGEPLSSMIPLDEKRDAAHVRLMMDEYRRHQEEGR